VESTFIENSNFGSCSALNGGAIYIGLSGIGLFDVNFTGNSASGLGNDVYFNTTTSQTFYTSTTFAFCCSYSDEIRFALSDGSTLDLLLPHCNSIQGERFVGATNADDEMNTCLNENRPCRSLGTAITRGIDAGDAVVMITVMGEYDDVSSSVSSGIFVHIRSTSAESQSVYI
jgi:hypothetical protein